MRFRYQLGEGIEFNGDWDCDYDDKWVPENDDQGQYFIKIDHYGCSVKCF